MRTLFDSSAFAKRYIAEKGSSVVDEICRNTTVLALSVLCATEILSALNRRLREDRLSRKDYLTAKHSLSEDVADAEIINLTSGVISRATVLLEANELRAMDALHIACVLEWNADLFVSSDRRQIKAARRSGLSVRFVEPG